MDKLTERVRKTIKEHHMVKPGDRVMAALSGGADSVCLLRILVQLRDILGILLRVLLPVPHSQTDACTNKS